MIISIYKSHMQSNVETLDKLKSNIENMSKYHQTEILKILSKRLCKLNENKSGVFVNLSFVPDDLLEELTKYIEYVDDQTETFATVEYQKNEFKTTLFSEKEDKDNNTLTNNLISR